MAVEALVSQGVPPRGPEARSTFMNPADSLLLIDIVIIFFLHVAPDGPRGGGELLAEMERRAHDQPNHNQTRNESNL